MGCKWSECGEQCGTGRIQSSLNNFCRSQSKSRFFPSNGDITEENKNEKHVYEINTVLSSWMVQTSTPSGFPLSITTKKYLTMKPIGILQNDSINNLRLFMMTKKQKMSTNHMIEAVQGLVKNRQ